MERTGEKPGAVRSAADVAAMVGLAAMTLLVFATVILRYFFAISFRWSDELARIIFIYIVFLGIAIAYRHREHIVIELLLIVLPERVRRVLAIPIHALVAALMLSIGVASLGIIFGKLGQALTPGLQIPRAYMYVAIPVGVFFLLLEILARLREPKRTGT